jgi:hypothetical protein
MEKYFLIFFSDRAFSYISGRWPTWHTVSSIIRLFEISACFEHPCAQPQEENCINTTCGVVTLKTNEWSKIISLDHSIVFRVIIPEVVLIQLSPWGWAQSCSKHVEDSNKHIIEETVCQFVHLPELWRNILRSWEDIRKDCSTSNNVQYE